MPISDIPRTELTFAAVWGENAPAMAPEFMLPKALA